MFDEYELHDVRWFANEETFSRGHEVSCQSLIYVSKRWLAIEARFCKACVMLLNAALKRGYKRLDADTAVSSVFEHLDQ